jgi:hypothetical protein
MQTPEGTKIALRFIKMINELIKEGELQSKYQFVTKYGIRPQNYRKLELEPGKRAIRPEWIAYLMIDHNVNPVYILTGKGPKKLEDD